MNKPLLIIVCGRPGSGKTTLAHTLSEMYRCPVLSRDEIKEGYINTVRREHKNLADEEIRNINSGFFEVMGLLADHNISCVVESAFQHKLWSPHYAELANKAAIKLVICRADNVTANKRYLHRKSTDPLREYFHGDSSIKDENDEYEYVPPQFPVPTLEVDTTKGYKPGLKKILSFIKGE